MNDQQTSQTSVITIRKDGLIVLAARVNYYALPFIERQFLALTNDGILKFTANEAIQFFTVSLLQAQRVEFLYHADNDAGDFLYLIDFDDNEVSFSVQHPTESIDNFSFTKLLMWSNEPATLIPTNIN